jgi:hypothetical protein
LIACGYAGPIMENTATTAEPIEVRLSEKFCPVHLMVSN